MVALEHSKNVIHRCNAPLSSVNDVPSYPTNLAMPILVKNKMSSFTPIRILDLNSNGLVIEGIVSLKNDIKCFTKTKGKSGRVKVLNFHLNGIDTYKEKCICYDDDVNAFFK